MLGASPKSELPLNPLDELNLLRERLPIKSKGMAILLPESTAQFTPHELTPLLTNTDFDILHVVGHGIQEGFLAVAKAPGQSVTISPQSFVNALRQRNEPVKLIVLCACFSGEWVRPFLEVAHAVVAMPAETYELSAREFSIGLYENLYSGMNLAHATENAKLLMRSLGDTTSEPTVETGGDDFAPETTYLHREPELLARFDEVPPKKKTRSNGVRVYFPVIYIVYLPGNVAGVRIALDTAAKDEEWTFDIFDSDDETYEIEYETWGNAKVMVLIEFAGGTHRVIKSDLVSLLTRHYSLLGAPMRQEVKDAIASLKRDGKPKSSVAKVGGKLLAKPSAKKAARKK
jgi:hypothetical protein